MLALWERSVRPTHAFLAEHDIQTLRPQVEQAFANDALHWWVICNESDQPVGFLGYTPGVVEALFIDPAYHRRGLGGRLLAHAQQLANGPLQVEVNEGNLGALQFYQRQGFVVVGRSPTDAEGRPFPLIRMRRFAPPKE
jgi:putative acetyltransferase